MFCNVGAMKVLAKTVNNAFGKDCLKLQNTVSLWLVRILTLVFILKGNNSGFYSLEKLLFWAKLQNVWKHGHARLLVAGLKIYWNGILLKVLLKHLH